MNQSIPRGHAIVIGGSIAGMLTARVLTNHFAAVTVIERDVLPTTPDFRKGAPQARHLHGLLARGQQIVEGYFPGIGAEMTAQGAVPTNMGSEFRLYINSRPVQPFPWDIPLNACSRALLEWAMGQRLRALEAVRFREGYDVKGLCTDADGIRATGVRIQARHNGAAEEVITGDLIVDASGRGSRLPVWLTALGFPAPAETVVDAQAGYATRIYRRTANHNQSWKVVYSIPQAPHQSRGCIIGPMEGERWQITLTGMNGDHPPTDAEGFVAFAHSIPVPELYRVLSQAEPLTDPIGYRHGANRLRHYERLPRHLEGVLAIGDSVYALNPVYGQGMTVAALGAAALDQLLGSLRHHPADNATGLARRFQGMLAKVNTGPWQMATGQDLRWPSAGTDYKPDPISRLVQGYFGWVLAAMVENGEIAAAFARVQHMLSSPASLFHPRIVWQVLRAKQNRSEQNSARQNEPIVSSSGVEQKAGVAS